PVDAAGNAIHGLKAQWQAITPGAASVSANGEVIANSTGASVLRATAGQITADVAVTVVSSAAAQQTRNKSGGSGSRIVRSSKLRKVNGRSTLFAHGRVVLPVTPLGGDEAESVFRPGNAVGAPPGKTTPGAQKSGAAVESVETPGSANFSFSLPVVSLSGRG